MKKINFLFMLMLALTVGIFTSCTDDETDPPTVVATLQGTPTYAPGTSVTYHLVIAANEDLVDFWAEESTTSLPLSDIENVDPIDAFEEGDLVNFSKNLNKVEFDYTYHIPATVGANTEITIGFEVNDKKSMTTETVTFTVVSGAGEISRFSAKLMGAQSNAEGSYLDASSGSVMVQSVADNAQGTIDIVYYYGNTNKATICAPSDVSVNGGTGNLSLCAAWFTKNATTFGASAVTETEFNGMTDDAMLSSIAGLSATKMTDLAVGDIFAFTTADDKNGLVRVTALTPDATGTITIDVVIQK
ncbi:MAG: hypothetical protein K9H64_20305 [Bacteroidales bacterium]|nr:hypothetical protein [Bacteroidales bacterium]MCF8458410.1 hypothetical protein [Bacteroidales bacterium]